MKRATPLGWLKHDITNRGITAWLSAYLILLFYIVLYFGHLVGKAAAWPKAHNVIWATIAAWVVGSGIYKISQAKANRESPVTHIIFMVQSAILVAALYFSLYYLKAMGVGYDPLEPFSKSIGLPGKWMLYGVGYTILITGFGIYMIRKYKHNKYQIIRTSVVIFVQAVLALCIPWLLKSFQKPEYYFSYIWPLKIDYFYPSTISYQLQNGLPVPVVVYSFVAGLVLAPAMAYFFGKRWYCSWVCGCGGLANTFGEPWRHLSDKSTTSHKVEKITIHTVLIAAVVLTILMFLSTQVPKGHALAKFGEDFRYIYGVLIISVLSGIAGVGLYPLGGTRVWCRFACPMAALLGLVQKTGRFHIKVKKDMCISCGMCSKYCEMGIDVRSYAQKNESFTRASCVGCGLCSEVCPRGVLRLENGAKIDIKYPGQ